MIVEGQVHGGVAQGIGQALLEGTHYDETGQLLTASYMDYTMPRADDLPSFKARPRKPPARPTRWASRAAARPAPSVRHRH
jgi:carbon-monoxide dehydrogenase large subunit